ncbi:MAG: hypothetical protein COA96_07365 [SAR86 cluster bacterium]|uniref:Glycosyltransferase RgtA/B/C/D-like domain-containing protein n=1 Tax=SAR86 cluster bacterium TaxID=2030880 RepID=A0A2A5B1U5_9GAMM|nr:MAG: hypothetical protein COA96_07365 [SAR86 cluster bacterium]
MNYNWRKLDIRIYAVMASLLISVYTLAFPDSPNNDAYIYIRTADLFLNEGLSAAFQYYEWATYSMLLGLVSLIGLDLFSAGLLVNALFYAVLVFAFVSLVKEIDDSKKLSVFAAISILVYPQLNEYRYFIIRDPGFWAFSVLALWQYLQYSSSRSIIHAFAFCGSLLIAATFRVEAVAYLLVTPLAILFDNRHERKVCIRLFFTLTGITVSAIVLATVFLSIIGLDVSGLFLGFISVYQPFIDSFFNSDQAQITELSRLLFNEHAASHSQEYITIFLGAGFFAILLATLFKAIGGSYLAVIIFGAFKKHIQLSRYFVTPLIAYLLVNALILFAFLFITKFLTTRYAMLFCIVLAVFVPVILWRVISSIRVEKLKAAYIVLALFFTYCGIDSYYSFGGKKDYVLDSINWLSENTTSTSGLVTNNRAIAYSTGKVENYDVVLRLLTEQQVLSGVAGDTIAIEMNREMEGLLSSTSIAPYLKLQTAFPDMQKQRLRIYQRINP